MTQKQTILALTATVERLELCLAANDHSQQYKQNIQELAVLPANWDSYGAPPPTREALLAAENLLQSKATLVPRSNGGVQIDWPGGSEISFNPDGSQEFDMPTDVLEREVLFIHKYNAILGPEITAERLLQDARYGTAHDDKHELVDWLNTRWGIPQFVDRAAVSAGSARLKYELGDASGIKYDPTERFEKAMISIAALAIAAVQSSRRKRNAQ